MSDMGPEPSSGWIDELDVTAAALLLALLDRDHERAQNLLESHTFNEVAQLAVNLAQGMIACVVSEDRARFRASVVELLKGLDGMTQWPDGPQGGPADPRTE